MNRVCSAGTGSFLEEQAIANGVDDIVEFGRLAALSGGPPDLGQTCTVFVADIAAEALGDGFDREDIFAGLQYSVVRNYRSRVMGQRRLLDRVFFQGKPATDPSLARTLAAVLEREVVVPADPGAMGAVGIALLAGRDAAGSGVRGTAAAALPAIDLTRVLQARVADRREFQCRDRDCQNLCHLELAEIDVQGTVEKIVSGGQCPKYDAVSAAGEKLPKDAPNPYRERAELLQQLLDEAGVQGEAGDREAAGARLEPEDRQRAASPPVPAAAAGLLVGLPYAHYLIDTLPFLHTLLCRLGYRVEVLRPGRDTLADGDRRCAAPGACAPVKLLHGLAGRTSTSSSPRSSCTFRCRTPAITRTRARWRRAPQTWSAGRWLPRDRRPGCCVRCSSRRRATASTRRVYGARSSGPYARSRRAPASSCRKAPPSPRHTGRRSTLNAASRPGCAASASARSRGRAGTATRSC